MMLDLQSYLAANISANQDHRVGQPLKIELDERQYAPRLGVELAGGERQTTLTAEPTDEPHQLVATLEDVDQVGFYTVHASSPAGDKSHWKLAVNVMPEEGDLRLIANEQLAAQLEGVAYDVHAASDIQLETHDFDRSNLATFVLFALAALLMVEQALANSASGHPKSAPRPIRH
jgi:hypothetical protein